MTPPQPHNCLHYYVASVRLLTTTTTPTAKIKNRWSSCIITRKGLTVAAALMPAEVKVTTILPSMLITLLWTTVVVDSLPLAIYSSCWASARRLLQTRKNRHTPPHRPITFLSPFYPAFSSSSSASSPPPHPTTSTTSQSPTDE